MNSEENKTELVTELSTQDFLAVGLDQVAYIRCVNDAEDSYAIYAADGSQISVMSSYDTAIAAIRINDLFPVTLH